MLPILAIAAVAGILAWMTIIYRGGLLAGCLLTIGVGVVLGYDLFHVGSLTADRLLLVVLVGTCFLLRWFGHTAGHQLTKADMIFATFIGYLILSTFMNDFRWNKNLPLSRLLFFYACPALMYLVTRHVVASSRALKWAFASTVLFGIYLSLTAVAETRGWYGAVFPKYIITSKTTEFLGRGRGPLLNPVGNGIYICIALSSALMLWPHVKRAGQMVLTGIGMILLIGAYCTLTRSVWIAAAGTVGITLILSLQGHSRRLLMVAGLLCAVTVLPVAMNKAKAFKRDKNVSVADMQSSASLRPIFARVAWLMFQERPLAGVGYGHYRQHSKHYLQDRVTPLRLNLAKQYEQHNLWLSLLVETGLIGIWTFTLTFIFWFISGWQLWQNRNAPLAIRQIGLMQVALTFTYFANGMFHELAIIPMVHMIYFGFSGLTVGLWTQYCGSGSSAATPALTGWLPGLNAQPAVQITQQVPHRIGSPS